MAQKHIKRIKLHRKYRCSNSLLNESMFKPIPWLNVSGVWLKEAGFNAGDVVEITIENKLLTIKNMSVYGDTSN